MPEREGLSVFFGRLCASVAQVQHCHRAERLVHRRLGDVARWAWSPERRPHRALLLVVASSSMGVRVRVVRAPCARSLVL